MRKFLPALAALLLLGLWLWLDARRTVRRLDRMLSTAIGQAAELSRAENRVVFIKELLK